MVKCVVYQCGNTQNNPPGQSFHRIPKDENRRKLWLEAIFKNQKRQDVVSPTGMVCADHFLTSDFIHGVSDNRIHLKRNAVPSVFKFTTKSCTKKSRWSTEKFANDPWLISAPPIDHKSTSSHVSPSKLHVSTDVVISSPVSLRLTHCASNLASVEYTSNIKVEKDVDIHEVIEDFPATSGFVKENKVCVQDISNLHHRMTNMATELSMLQALPKDIDELKKKFSNFKSNKEKQCCSSSELRGKQNETEGRQDSPINCDDIFLKMISVVGELEKTKDDILHFASWLNCTQKNLVEPESLTANNTIDDDDVYEEASSDFETMEEDTTEPTIATSQATNGNETTCKELILANQRMWQYQKEIKMLNDQIGVLQNEKTKLSTDLDASQVFVKEYVTKWMACDEKGILKKEFSMTNVKSNKQLFSYYTGFESVEVYNCFYKFVNPDNATSFSKKITMEDQILLVLARLRQGFDVQDLSFRFNANEKLICKIFNGWIAEFYFRLGNLRIFPDRNVILENAPLYFKKHFPKSFLILDFTEIKIQQPSSASCSTVKGLIGCDPRGGIVFVSQLFSESITDEQVTRDSGLYDVLKRKIEVGEILEGDSVMVDAGLAIDNEIQELRLSVDIPPCSSSHQFSETELKYSCKTHVERAIRKVKAYKIFNGPISNTLTPNLSQIWTVCCLLSNVRCANPSENPFCSVSVP